MKNHRDTLLAQYANSPTLVALIDAFNAWVGPEADLENLYRNVVDVSTATGNGLDIWGRIVGISRYLKIETEVSEFGFAEQREESTPAEATPQPFDSLGTMRDTVNATTTYRLADDAYRKLILAKATTNITDATAASINFALTVIFGDRGKCYVQDNGNMTINYVFGFGLSPMDKAILYDTNAIPRPAGVLMNVVEALESSTFGFVQAGLQPFGSGVFYVGKT